MFFRLKSGNSPVCNKIMDVIRWQDFVKIAALNWMGDLFFVTIVDQESLDHHRQSSIAFSANIK